MVLHRLMVQESKQDMRISPSEKAKKEINFIVFHASLDARRGNGKGNKERRML